MHDDLDGLFTDFHDGNLTDYKDNTEQEKDNIDNSGNMSQQIFSLKIYLRMNAVCK